MAWQTPPRQRDGRRASQCSMGPWLAIHHKDIHPRRDLSPTLPAMKLRQIIRPHDPYKPNARITALQNGERIDGETRMITRLNIRGPQPGMARHRLR